MKTTELTPMQRIGLESLWLGARVFAAMPYWFKYYVVENLIFCVARYCLRYRMKVVKTNLRNSFPEKDERELAVIRRRFYRTLAEIFVDTINLAGLTPEKGRSLLTVKGLEEQKERVGGRDWIAMTAHFGCWEYCSFWGLYDPTQIVVAVYHPLRSRIVEAFYQRLRNGDYATTVAMKESLRFYLRNRAGGIGGRNLVMGLIADQNPPRRPDSRWFRFLNQDTIFFDGGEKLALRCQLPVYFVDGAPAAGPLRDVLRTDLRSGKEEVAEYEITQRYVRMLEAEIRRRPELWMVAPPLETQTKCR